MMQRCVEDKQFLVVAGGVDQLVVGVEHRLEMAAVSV